MKTDCTEAQIAALTADTEGATLYLDPPGSAPPLVSLGTHVKHAMAALTSGRPQSAEIQLREGCWLNSDQIRQLHSRFTR